MMGNKEKPNTKAKPGAPAKDVWETALPLDESTMTLLQAGLGLGGMVYGFSRAGKAAKKIAKAERDALARGDRLWSRPLFGDKAREGGMRFLGGLAGTGGGLVAGVAAGAANDSLRTPEQRRVADEWRNRKPKQGRK